MMQDRTFRGQSADGVWHEGFLIRSPGVKNSRPGEGWYINSEQEPAYAHLVKPFTIGMSTGVKDMEGTMVFEGDIIKTTGSNERIFSVEFGEYMRGATAKNLEPKDLASYYPFRVGWKLGNVAEMSKVIPAGFADFVIYTSAIEHMHPVDGAKSLAECYKVMKPGAKMFLSCPNTPGNGYQTQYRAHVYEWGYDELKSKLAEIGFSIVQEVGLVTSVREMDEFYSKQEPALRDFYTRMKAYVPSAFLTTFMAIPFPREAKELLFIVQKPKGEENNG